MHFQDCVVERRVRTDQRWVEGVGAGGGKPGSGARVRRSLDVDQHVVDVEPAERRSTTTTSRNNVASRGAAGSSGGVIRKISRRRKTQYGGFE
jgi:hypothetical protein